MRIVFATGGSGGHLFPALKTAEFLRSLGHDIYFVGAFRFGKDKLLKSGFNFIELDIEGLSLRRPLSLVKLINATRLCLGRLKALNVQVVVGFGGYGSFPAVMAAVLLKLPTMIHEQNVIPGKANKLLSKFVRKIAISFQESAAYFDRRKVVLTGCPCHGKSAKQERDKVLMKLGFNDASKTLLVIGGSQGSQNINKAFIEAITKVEGLDSIQVIHSCGAADVDFLSAAYKKMNVHAAVFKFIDNIEEIYTITDVVIARAGALCVCEIACFGLPAILIPYPHAHGHQKANALELVKTGPGIVIEEQTLTSEFLVQAITEQLEGKRSPKQWYEPVARLAQHAEKTLAKEIANCLT